MYDVVTTFNDGHARYYQGERVVAQNFDPADLSKFVEYCWIKPVGAEPASVQSGVEFTLDIQDGRLGQETEI